ncbi:MAG: rod shape-determining protein MreC [Candidatus Portnoybacteria bacterium]|nr:rod shape-determining protein MreC [Candidatus Portnoybacteria bacterium]
MRKFFSHPLILSLLIIFSLVFFNYQGWLKVPQDIILKLTNSTQETIYQYSLKINGFFNFLFSMNSLDQENIELKQENIKLFGQVIQLEEVVRENEFLRQQMELEVLENNGLILAHIIGWDSSNSGKSFLINKGKKNGVKEKAAIITSGNILVGQVIEVFDSFSIIQSILDPNSRINALIQESGITGLIRGNQGLNLILDLLPQREEIKEDQVVITSGLAGIFPPGLLIGKIQKVFSLDVQMSQTAEIEPIVDFNNLEKVFVIKLK